MDAAAKPVGDRGKKELPIKGVDMATFVITPALTALNFGGNNYSTQETLFLAE